MSTGLQGQKIMYTTLFMGKVCKKNPDFDKDKTDVMFGLTLHDCIFHFPLCTSQGIKASLKNKVKDQDQFQESLVPPCLSFFFLSLLYSLICNILSLSLSKSFSLPTLFLLQVPLDPVGAGPRQCFLVNFLFS